MVAQLLVARGELAHDGLPLESVAEGVSSVDNDPVVGVGGEGVRT